MKSRLSMFSSAGILLLIVLMSCNKNEDQQPSSSLQTSSESLLTSATNTISGAGDQQSSEVSDVVGDGTLMGNDSSVCRIVSFSPSRSAFPHVRNQLTLAPAAPGPMVLHEAVKNWLWYMLTGELHLPVR